MWGRCPRLSKCGYDLRCTECLIPYSTECWNGIIKPVFLICWTWELYRVSFLLSFPGSTSTCNRYGRMLGWNLPTDSTDPDYKYCRKEERGLAVGSPKHTAWRKVTTPDRTVTNGGFWRCDISSVDGVPEGLAWSQPSTDSACDLESRALRALSHTGLYGHIGSVPQSQRQRHAFLNPGSLVCYLEPSLQLAILVLAISV